MRSIKRSALLVLCCLLFALAACGAAAGENSPPDGQATPNEQGTSDEQTPPKGPNAENEEADVIFLTIGKRRIPVKLEKNAAADALLALLEAGDITYTAHGYGGFEAVGSLGHALPRSDRQMTAEAGDVILYSGDQIVLFYGSNSWSYTKLGKMQGLSAAEIAEILTKTDPISIKIGL